VIGFEGRTIVLDGPDAAALRRWLRSRFASTHPEVSRRFRHGDQADAQGFQAEIRFIDESDSTDATPSKAPRPGDRCKRCGGFLRVASSRKRGASQLRYIRCGQCGHTAGKQSIPATEVRRRRY